MADLIEPNDRTVYFVDGRATKAGLQFMRAVFRQIGGYQAQTPDEAIAAIEAQAMLFQPGFVEQQSEVTMQSISIEQDFQDVYQR